MGFNIILEDEHRTKIEQIDDPKGLLYDILPEAASRSFHYLPYIDRYGDTIFNRPQMEPFLGEWGLLIAGSKDLEARRLLTEVRRLATEVRDQVHLYLRFVGE
jgi:hypothetical protein